MTRQEPGDEPGQRRRRVRGGPVGEGPTERILRPGEQPTQHIPPVGAQPPGDNRPTGVIKRPVEQAEAPPGPPTVRATVPQYPVSQTARFGVVLVPTVLVHFLMVGMLPNAEISGYVQLATLLLCMAVPPTALGVFFDQPHSKFSRWMLFFVGVLCAFVAGLDATAWVKSIL